MSTQTKIDHLVDDLKPVKVVKPLSFRLLTWILCVGAGVGLLLNLIDTRKDVVLVLQSGRLATSAMMVFALAFVSSWGALKSSIPGENREFLLRSTPVLLLIIWSGFTFAQIVLDYISIGIEAIAPDSHRACAIIVGSLGGTLAIPLGLSVRKAAPLDLRWSGALVGLASAMGAMIGIELICESTRGIHIGLFHVVPVLIMALMGFWLGPKLLKTK